MKQALIDSIVQAVLYEGYILYPYRPMTAVKKDERFAFGWFIRALHQGQSRRGVVPDADGMPDGRAAGVERENHGAFSAPDGARDRGAGDAVARGPANHGNPDFFHVVPALVVEGERYETRQEAVERTIRVPKTTLSELTDEIKLPFSLAATRTIEPIRNHAGLIEGVMVRRQAAIAGVLELAAEKVEEFLFKITARIVNRSPVPAAWMKDPAEIAMRTFASTHTILHTENGKFISMIDPPLVWTAQAAGVAISGRGRCWWATGRGGERDVVVSSAAILYDYPTGQAESAEKVVATVGGGRGDDAADHEGDGRKEAGARGAEVKQGTGFARRLRGEG